MDVIVGEHQISSTSDGTRHEICRYVDHPQYDDWNQNNDFSILHLKQPVKIGSRAVPACLAKPSMGGDFFVGKSMTVSGWGTLAYGDYTPDVLHSVNVPGVTNSKCDKVYQAMWKPAITDHMLCAGQPSGGIDSCQGDSGGKQ